MYFLRQKAKQKAESSFYFVFTENSFINEITCLKKAFSKFYVKAYFLVVLLTFFGRN